MTSVSDDATAPRRFAAFTQLGSAPSGWRVAAVAGNPAPPPGPPPGAARATPGDGPWVSEVRSEMLWPAAPFSRLKKFRRATAVNGPGATSLYAAVPPRLYSAGLANPWLNPAT